MKRLSIIHTALFSLLILLSGCSGDTELLELQEHIDLQNAALTSQLQQQIELNRTLEAELISLKRSKLDLVDFAPLEMVEYLAKYFLTYLPVERGINRNFYATKFHFYADDLIGIDLSNNYLERRLLVRRMPVSEKLVFETVSLFEPLSSEDWSLLRGDITLPTETLFTFGLTSNGEWKEISQPQHAISDTHEYVNQWYKFKLILPLTWSYWGQGEVSEENSLFRILLKQGTISPTPSDFDISVDVVDASDRGDDVRPAVKVGDGMITALLRLDEGHDLYISSTLGHKADLLELAEKVEILKQ